MSSDQKHHEEVIFGLYRQLEQIFVSSEQAVYLYLDDIHKFCNGRMASLLGYSSPEEWMKIENFMDTVALRSQSTLMSAYQDAMEKKVGSTISVRWKKKSGGTVDTTVIIVPIPYQEHLLALHFISEKK